jgi:DNA-binding transcriptional MerR regulator
MSNYTTGDMARLCEVTVRTVQFYDAKNLLKPAALSEGGRRLYTEDDMRKLKLICLL